MEMTTLDELQRLLKAGTPGPWEKGDGKRGELNLVYCDDALGSALFGVEEAVTTYEGMERWEANAALIVAAINALPGLLAKLERYDDALDEIAAHYNGGITGPGRLQADSMRDIARAALAKDAPPTRAQGESS